MKRTLSLVAGLMTSIVMAGNSAIALAANSEPADSSEARATRIADKDFGRLSADGVRAFNDVHLARIAIYDGKTDEAAKFIADAQSALGKAKTDEAILMKAESELKVSPKATPAETVAAEKNAPPIAWIPIDNDIVFGETFQPTTGKVAAIGTAKKALARGDGTTALKAIKLADVYVDYTVAVAPLEQSVAAVNDASKLIASHDYFGASQSLKKAEDGIRYDEFDDVADIKGKASHAIAKTK
jgi:hypothetical protein